MQTGCLGIIYEHDYTFEIAPWNDEITKPLMALTRHCFIVAVRSIIRFTFNQLIGSLCVISRTVKVETQMPHEKSWIRTDDLSERVHWGLKAGNTSPRGSKLRLTAEDEKLLQKAQYQQNLRSTGSDDGSPDRDSCSCRVKATGQLGTASYGLTACRGWNSSKGQSTSRT